MKTSCKAFKLKKKPKDNREIPNYLKNFVY